MFEEWSPEFRVAEPVMPKCIADDVYLLGAAFSARYAAA
jgi:hypothetical protein